MAKLSFPILKLKRRIEYKYLKERIILIKMYYKYIMYNNECLVYNIII